MHDKKVRKIFLIIFLFYGISYSQDIITISTVEDLDRIKADSKGNVMLVNFWATWCKPCTEEFPELLKVHEKYKEQNFRLILISLDFKEEFETKLKPFLSDKKVDFTTYYLDTKNPDDIMNYFDVKWDGGIPATFIFDKSGNLKKSIIGSKDFDFFDIEIRELL